MTSRSPTTPTRATAWTGWILFASVMLAMVGIFAITMGLVALFRENYFAVGPAGLLVEVNYTTWGWVHLVLGVVQVATALGLLAGKTWARAAGITLAALNALVNMAFLAAFPLWATLVIAFDIITIYAIAVHGGEVSPEYD
ncbi:DUF7144 family membrane protein [Paractinoplanes maris]|uniref:DUF7144 family membrane protein n=1 Tax=Paractinoplanes maris TaxID=1734446 RepID=UPI0020213161|nr:hypothetical protein [Actinoplanes maris]